MRAFVHWTFITDVSFPPVTLPEAGSHSEIQAIWFLLLFASSPSSDRIKNRILVSSSWNWYYWDRCYYNKNKAQSHCEFFMLRLERKQNSLCYSNGVLDLSFSSPTVQTSPGEGKNKLKLRGFLRCSVVVRWPL